MFIAHNQQGEKFSLLENHKRDQLLKVRQTENFTCPGCGEPVILKLGEKRISHFAHLKSTSCPSFSEHESQYHLKGKMQLYEWLKRQSFSVELEPYLKKLQQRPDILVVKQNQKFAIEFQCSLIPEKIFVARSSSYLMQGYTPIWILGASHLKRTFAQNTKMSSFRWLFSYPSSRFDHIPIFLYYCPIEKKFFKLFHIYPFSPNIILSNMTFSTLEKLNFQQLFSVPPFNQFDLFMSWLKKKQHWRRKTSMFLYKSARKFTQELYHHQIFLPYLPAEVGIPLKSLYWIETPAFIWQMYILLDSILPLQIGDKVTFHHAYQKFQARKFKGLIKIRTLPLLKQTHYSFAIMEYLSFLEQVGVLKRIAKSTFIKIREIKKFHSIKEAEAYDKIVLDELLKKNPSLII